MPGIRALGYQYVTEATLAFGRVKLDIPRLADNGNAVPMRIGAMPGPFLPTAPLRSIRLYSEKNPVPLMMRLDFPVAPPRAEIDSRIRLAGTQRVVAVAGELGDGTLGCRRRGHRRHARGLPRRHLTWRSRAHRPAADRREGPARRGAAVHPPSDGRPVSRTRQRAQHPDATRSASSSHVMAAWKCCARA